MNRRGFLGTILALGVAPAIVRASSLMPLTFRGVPVVFDEEMEIFAPRGGGPIASVTDLESLPIIRKPTREDMAALWRTPGLLRRDA